MLQVTSGSKTVLHCKTHFQYVVKQLSNTLFASFFFFLPAVNRTGLLGTRYRWSRPGGDGLTAYEETIVDVFRRASPAVAFIQVPARNAWKSSSFEVRFRTSVRV